MLFIKKFSIVFLLLGSQIFAEISPPLPSEGGKIQNAPVAFTPLEKNPPKEPLPFVSPRNKEIQKPSSDHFSYLSIGVRSLTQAYLRYQNINLMIIPDVFVGQRYFFFPRLAVDFGLGANVHPYPDLQCLYGQASLLGYVDPGRGAYGGLGLFAEGYRDMRSEAFSVLTRTDFLLIAGYQFDLYEMRSFIQFQVSPEENSTISYGFGF